MTTTTRAAVAIVTAEGYSLGYADRGVAGYTPTTYTYDSYAAASDAAHEWNDRAGLSRDDALEIVVSSMRGPV